MDILFNVEAFLGNGLVSLALLEQKLEERMVVEICVRESPAGKLGTNADLLAAHERIVGNDAYDKRTTAILVWLACISRGVVSIYGGTQTSLSILSDSISLFMRTNK